MNIFLRSIHGRFHVESDVTTARGPEADEGLHVLQIIDLVLLSFASVSVNGENKRFLCAKGTEIEIKSGILNNVVRVLYVSKYV